MDMSNHLQAATFESGTLIVPQALRSRLSTLGHGFGETSVDFVDDYSVLYCNVQIHSLKDFISRPSIPSLLSTPGTGSLERHAQHSNYMKEPWSKNFNVHHANRQQVQPSAVWWRPSPTQRRNPSASRAGDCDYCAFAPVGSSPNAAANSNSQG